MFVKTPSLDAIVARAHDLLVGGDACPPGRRSRGERCRPDSDQLPGARLFSSLCGKRAASTSPASGRVTRRPRSSESRSSASTRSRAAAKERSIRCASVSMMPASTMSCRSMKSLTSTRPQQRVVGRLDRRMRAPAAGATAGPAPSGPIDRALRAPSAAASRRFALIAFIRWNSAASSTTPAVAILDDERAAGDQMRHVGLVDLADGHRPGMGAPWPRSRRDGSCPRLPGRPGAARPRASAARLSISP